VSKDKRHPFQSGLCKCIQIEFLRRRRRRRRRRRS
jgi:hypothetical protein